MARTRVCQKVREDYYTYILQNGTCGHKAIWRCRREYQRASRGPHGRRPVDSWTPVERGSGLHLFRGPQCAHCSREMAQELSIDDWYHLTVKFIVVDSIRLERRR